MGVYNLLQISKIISKRPNKTRIAAAQKLNKKLMLHLHGVGMKGALKQLDYFENSDIYKAREEYAISNVDLYGRVLQEEEQVFTAKGGSSYFNLPTSEEKQMHDLLSDVIYGQSLRKWVANFGLNAYRCDPMGVIFMEVQQVTDIQGSDAAQIGASPYLETPKCYPVYKCIQDIWDYQPNGRKLDYICFALTDDELEMYGIQEKQNDSLMLPANQPQNKYFRFVDDEKDIIVVKGSGAAVSGITTGFSGDMVQLAPLASGYKNNLPNEWGQVPGFIISDLIKFSEPGSFNTPLWKVVELSDCFLKDRSVRNLQVNYHGFAKAVEPLTACVVCGGEGFSKGKPCPECTIPGQDKGSGYKTKTKISDVFRIPLTILEQNKAPHFNFKNIFGYVTPDIESWNKQDDNLQKLEDAMYITYWGCANAAMSGYNGKQSAEDTATKTIADLQPKFARMNTTADWAELTENAIADFIGKFWFGDTFKKSNISYSRDYIFESADTILATYYDMKANGVPDSMLDSQYEKYLKALWRANPVQAEIYHKKFDVEPFPHLSADAVELSAYITDVDKVAKRYFGEWDDTIKDPVWLFKDSNTLRKQLIVYAQAKNQELKDMEAEQQKQDLEKQTALSLIPKMAA